MTLDQEHEALVTFRFHQADDTLKVVEFLISADKLNLAANRVYFGMYYALNGLAAHFGVDTTEHYILYSWFNREFILTSRADPVLGKIFRNAYRCKERADHDPFIKFSPVQLEQLHAELIRFKNDLKGLIS